VKVDLPAFGMEGQLRTDLTLDAGRGSRSRSLDFLTTLWGELYRLPCQMLNINGERGVSVALTAGLEEQPDGTRDDQALSDESVMSVFVPGTSGLPVPPGEILAGAETAIVVAPAVSSLEAPGVLLFQNEGASLFEFLSLSCREAAEQALPGTEAVSFKPGQLLATDQNQAAWSPGSDFLSTGTDSCNLPLTELETDSPVNPGSRQDEPFTRPDLYAESGRISSGEHLDVNPGAEAINQSVNAEPTAPARSGTENRPAGGDPGWKEPLPVKAQPEMFKAGAGESSSIIAGESVPVIEDGLTMAVPEVNGTGPGENLIGSEKIARNLLEQLQSRVSYLRESVGFPAEIRVKLDPPQLGEVLIRVISRQGRLSAEIVTEIAAVKEMLFSSLGELHQRLDQMNLHLERIDLLTARDLSSGADRFSEGNFQREQAGGRNFKMDPREEALPCPGWATADGYHGVVNCWA